MWVKVIENPKGKTNTQSGFITIEWRGEKKYLDLVDLLKRQNIYGFRELGTFPWMKSYYYEDTIVDVKYD